MLESFFKRFLRWSTTHWAIFFALCVVVLAVSILSASQLQLRSSLKELLPERYQSVVQLNRMLDRVGGISVLTVTIESDNVEANKKFVDDLSKKLETLPRDEVRYVNSKVTPIREFYEKNILHFVDREDLKTLYTRLKRVIDYEKIKRSPLFLDLGEDPPPATLQFDDIKERNRKNVKMPLAVVDDYYGGEEGRFLIMMIRPQGAALAVDRARALIAKVKGMVNELDPASYDPEMRIGYCGNVVTTVEEYDTLKTDMVSTAGLCVLLVAGVIVLYFLRIRIVGFLGITLVFSVAMTFALTRLLIGYLNAQTAFLTSIIIGTGINYGIIIVGRYLEERKNGMSPLSAMDLAATETARPTFLAAATTAVSFLVLTIARVRGLSQFGVIGSMGVMLCWGFSFLIFPTMVVVSENVLKLFRRLSFPKRDSAILRAMDEVISRFSPVILILTLMAAMVAAFAVYTYLPNSIEYDFSKLRNKVSASEGTEALERRVAKLWIGSMTPAVVLLDSPDDGPAVCDAVMRQNDQYPPELRPVDNCYTVKNLLPADQDAKAPLLARIDHLLDPSWIDDVEGDFGDLLRRAKDSLRKPKIEVGDLPEELVRNFMDLEGGVGTFAFINPRSGMPLSDGRNLMRFAATISNIELPDGRVMHATGEYLIFADLIRIVKEDAPTITLFSFVAVALFVYLTIRRFSDSVVIIIALMWGVLMMVGVMALIDMRINFFNFIALPLTFGIGVDYSLNVAMRLTRDKSRRTVEIMRHTGGAVILCSATTIIGYYVLTMSNNQAVAQFGWMAIIGELTCIFAAIFIVPALVLMGRKLAAKRGRKE